MQLQEEFCLTSRLQELLLPDSEVGQSLQNLTVLRGVKGPRYVWTRLAMGMSHAPWAAQVISEGVLKAAGLQGLMWIDNGFVPMQKGMATSADQRSEQFWRRFGTGWG